MTARRAELNSLLLAALALLTAHRWPPLAEGASKACKQKKRADLCAYARCVMGLDNKDRDDAKVRMKECSMGGSEEEDGCLATLTAETMDDFAALCLEGELSRWQSCQLGKNYVSHVAAAEAEDEAEAEVVAVCGKITDACMNKNNWSKCKELVEGGCKSVSVMESCPLQFDCADDE